jgi:hypothetical protein
VAPARTGDNSMLIITSGKCSNFTEFEPFAQLAKRCRGQQCDYRPLAAPRFHSAILTWKIAFLKCIKPVYEI